MLSVALVLRTSKKRANHMTKTIKMSCVRRESGEPIQAKKNRLIIATSSIPGTMGFACYFLPPLFGFSVAPNLPRPIQY